MLISVVMTFRLHICDMFDEILVMASRGLCQLLVPTIALVALLHCYLPFIKVSCSFG